MYASLDVLTIVAVAVATVVAAVYVISGIDDVIFDIYYWLRQLRRLFVARKYPKLTLEMLESKEQQKIAVFVPAWQEANVIYDMLVNTCSTISYYNYDIFVGTYPNDPDTQKEVDRAAQRCPQIRKVVAPTDGPTTKADNLNSIYQAMRARERELSQRFEIIAVHDSEDIIHPYSFKLYNYLIPRKDMIQIPVFPSDRSLWHVTHWTYASEFAENHTKDLLVREVTKGFVPAAGVGSAFSRRAFDILSETQDGELFNLETLTEDYNVGLRLRLKELDTVFVHQLLECPKKVRRGIFSKREETVIAKDRIATRSLFPLTFSSAVRQKTRWIIGIALQSWKMDGWVGGSAVRYNLLRDRKVLFTNILNVVGYVVFVYFVLYEIFRRVETQYALAPIIIKGTLLWYLVVAATILMAERLLQGLIATWRIYGFWAAILSVPYKIWANFINFSATIRAIWHFFTAMFRRRRIAWSKTAHAFPSPSTLEDTMQDPEHQVELAGFELRAEIPRDRQRRALEAVTAAAPGSAEPIPAAFKSEDWNVRAAAIRALDRETGRRHALLLIAALGDEAWQVRCEAARTLGFLRFAEAADALAEAMRDWRWPVRANAAKALAKLGAMGRQKLEEVAFGDDKFASELAVRTVEQQGAIQETVRALESEDAGARTAARDFFSKLASGPRSSVARYLLEIGGYNEDGSPKEKAAA